MTSYLFIILGAVLVNNVVFVRILGLCPFMGVSKKLETAAGMGAATTFVLTMACGASYIIDRWLLIPNRLEYLRTLSFIVTIAAIVQLTELVIQKTSPLLHQVLGIYLPLITTNCAVLGVPLLNVACATTSSNRCCSAFGSARGLLRWRWSCSPASANASKAPTCRCISAARPSP
jgi:electron transport complex protein RnfA